MQAYDFGPWREPAACCVFGGPGVGKSTDALLTFPDAWILAGPGGLKSAQTMLGAEMYAMARAQVVMLSDLGQVPPFFEMMQSGKIPKRPVIIDDASLAAEGTFHRLRPHYPAKKTFQLYEALKFAVLEVRNAAKWAGVHCVMNAHPIPNAPYLDQAGRLVIKGPLLGAKSCASVVTHAFDVVYEAVADETHEPWPAVYECTYPSTVSATKDRHSVIRGRGPLNLREILRSAGYVMPRPVPWIDEAIPQVCEEITAQVSRDVPEREAKRSVIVAWRARLAGKVDLAHTRWMLRDALDRWDLQRRPDWTSDAFSGAAPKAVTVTAIADLEPGASTAPSETNPVLEPLQVPGLVK